MGGWLRASSGKSGTLKEGSQGASASSNNSMNSSKTGDNDIHKHGYTRSREVQTKRNLQPELSRSAASRTGVEVRDRGSAGPSPGRVRSHEDTLRGRDLRDDLENRREKDLRSKLVEEKKLRGEAKAYGDGRGKEEGQSSHGGRGEKGRWADVDTGSRRYGSSDRRRGYYVKKYRPDHGMTRPEDTNIFEAVNKKRRPKQLWVAKDDPDRQIIHDGFIRDNRRKTASVFDRIEEDKDKEADPEGRGRQEQ